MTKQTMMTEAHKMAKTFEGNYTACLALALRTLNKKEETKMTKSEAVELFLENNKSIEYGTKGRVLIITNEISNDIKKFFKGNFGGSLRDLAEKNDTKTRAINTLDEKITDFIFEKCGSAFSNLK